MREREVERERERCGKGQRESKRERECVRESERNWTKRGEVISREGERREER
jgi:hypothetical protein